MMRRVRNTFMANYLGLLIAIVAISVFLTVASHYFLKGKNFVNIGNQIAINLIIAAGMTLVITMGGIDLSVGSNLALTGIIVALFLKKFGPGLEIVLLGMLIGLALGVVFGFGNALIINKLGAPPFIATLGTMGVFRGLALVFSNGRVIYKMPRAFEKIFAGFVFGFPKPLIVAAVILAISAFLLNRTTLGRFARIIGGNENCARVSGMRIETVKMVVYIYSGLLAAMGGLALTAMMNAAEPIAGNFYELDAIAVVVMGGTLLQGGKGTITGTILGALLLGVVRNGLNLMRVPVNFHQFLVGVIILVAVVSGSRRANR
jgi:ribose transport system permease protein